MLRKIIFVIISFSLLFSACGTPGGGFRYAIDEGEITITRYVGFSKNIVIPKEINGMPVVTIFNEAFRKKGLRSVVIPDSVTHIESQAFAENKLTSIVIPDSVVYIGARSFAENRLTSVVIPDSVIEIDAGAFMDNRLTSVVVSNPDTDIGEMAFARNSVKSARTPFSVMTQGDAITIIGYNRNEKNLIIPESIDGLPVVAIGDEAFDEKN